MFEAALFINWKVPRKDRPVVALSATVGVALAAAVTAVGMHYVLVWDWGTAILSALIAATDPVSVIAIFKEARVQGHFHLLVEAESLLNDGTDAFAFIARLTMCENCGSLPDFEKQRAAGCISTAHGFYDAADNGANADYSEKYLPFYDDRQDVITTLITKTYTDAITAS